MPPPRAQPRSSAPLPWQLVVRAAMVITGATLLLAVRVEGTATYVAWGLIVLALLSEAAAMLVHRQRTREQRRR